MVLVPAIVVNGRFLDLGGDLEFFFAEVDLFLLGPLNTFFKQIGFSVSIGALIFSIYFYIVSAALDFLSNFYLLFRFC